MCRLGGATCPSSALRCIPQNGAGYLRVVLGEEVGPVRRRGDAYDKYSLDCEETENTVRLRADRHFPLNIQETGINKRRTGRTVSRRWAKNNRAPEKVFGGSWWLAEASGHFSRQWNLKQRRAERIGSWRPGRSGSGRCCAAAVPLMCLLAYLRTHCPPSHSAHLLLFSPTLSNVESIQRSWPTQELSVSIWVFKIKPFIVFRTIYSIRGRGECRQKLVKYHMSLLYFQ